MKVLSDSETAQIEACARIFAAAIVEALKPLLEDLKERIGDDFNKASGRLRGYNGPL